MLKPAPATITKRAYAEARRMALIYARRAQHFWWCDLEDLTSEATTVVASALYRDGFDPSKGSSQEAYFGRMAAFACVEFMRKMGSPASGPKKHRAKVLEGIHRAPVDQLAGHVGDLGETVEDRQWAGSVREALGRWLWDSPEIRDVLAGRPATEVAAEYGVHVACLRKRVQAARAEMQADPALCALRADLRGD